MIKTTRNPETGEITITKEETKASVNRKISIPVGTEGDHEYTEKKPFSYEVEFDPDFYTNYPDEKGNYKIVVKGQAGEKTTKWTIKNSEIVGKPEIVKDTEPVNAIIKVGQKDYTGTINYKESHEIPFEVEYRYSDELESGQIRVEQKGEKGSYDIEYSQKIKNGVKDGEATPTRTNEREAKKEIIVIGTKSVEKVVEKPFNTEYIYDESLESGKTEEVTSGKNGKVTITTSYNKETGEVETNEVEEQATNRVVKIGGKTNGTEVVKEILPFEIEVKKDLRLKKGEWEYAKDEVGNELKGEMGEQEKTLTIVNSKVTETSNPTVTKNPKKAVILVGEEDYTGTVTHKETIETPFEVEYEYSDKLEVGQLEIKQKGEKGSYDLVYSQNIKNGQADGKAETSKENEKESKKEIIVIGTKPVEEVIERPFNTEYQYDESLEAGKTEEVTPGKNGIVTIATSYDQDQKKVVTSKTEEEGQNRVIKIGGKTNGTEKVKEEIPFEVEVRKDPTIKKGEWKYALDDKGKELKGEKGEIEKTLTIINSKITEVSEPTVIKEAKKAIILVGEDTISGNHEIKEKKEIPFETRVEYDPNLEAGQREETGGEVGEQERTNTLVIKDGEVEKTTEGKFETTKDPVDRVIKIGIKPITKEVEKEFETEYIYDENIEMGKEEEVTSGKKGKVTITTSYDKDQNKLITEEKTEDAVNRVVRIGIKPVITEEKIPNDTKFKHNPDLAAGEVNKIKDGTPGTVTITTTFNKETGKFETKVEKTKPINAEYEYGSMTSGKVKVKSKYHIKSK